MKVLVIDDAIGAMTVIKAVIQHFFRDSNCKDIEIVSAVDGNIGLHLLREEGPFDLILTDMEMPGLTGIELLGIIRNGGTEGGRKGTPRDVRVGLFSTPDYEEIFGDDFDFVMNKVNSIYAMRDIFEEQLRIIPQRGSN